VIALKTLLRSGVIYCSNDTVQQNQTKTVQAYRGETQKIEKGHLFH